MKVRRITLVLLLSLILFLLVFAKGSHGGRSTLSHSQSSRASKTSQNTGSNDSRYEGGPVRIIRVDTTRTRKLTIMVATGSTGHGDSSSRL